MLNIKKTLIACTVLTALAASAFAATEQNAQQEKCFRGPRCEKRQDFKQNKMAPLPRPKLSQEERAKLKEMTPEQRKAFMKKKHAEFYKNLSPEDKARYDQHRKLMKERREAHQKLVKEKMSKLTPEQRAEVQQYIKDDIAQRKAMMERMKKMTPEQREAIRVSRPGFRHMHKPAPGQHPHMKGAPHGNMEAKAK